MAKITTNAHAMLGLLAIRSWSSYELAKYMLWSNLRAIWPRAESRIYEEPKRLAREGLAESKVGTKGGRSRTVHRITRRGRNALRRWLGEPSSRFRYRSEALVKISFADFGSLDHLRRQIDGIRDEARQDAETMLEFAEQRSKEGAMFPERAHVNALTDSFIIDLIEMRLRWADFAADFVRDWESAAGDEASCRQGEEWWTATRERLGALLRGSRAG